MEKLLKFELESDYNLVKESLEFPVVSYINETDTLYISEEILPPYIELKYNLEESHKLSSIDKDAFNWNKVTLNDEDITEYMVDITVGDMYPEKITLEPNVEYSLKYFIDESVDTIKSKEYAIDEMETHGYTTNYYYESYIYDLEYCYEMFIPKQIKYINENALNANRFISTSIRYEYYLSSLENIIFEEGSQLITIGDSAFYFSLLESIKIPSSVTRIGYEAFRNCYDLTNVTFEEGSQLTTIGSYAFQYCESLTSITIPSSVTTIGYKAFSGCTFIKDNFINNSSLDAEANDYWGATIIDEITEDGLIIKDNIVIDCKEDATSVNIPSSVTSIGYKAFYGCYSLTRVTFEEDSQLTSIDNYAFQDCESLTSITIPSSVTSINSYAFATCIFDIDNFINNSSLDAEANDYWGATVYDTLTDDGLYIRNNIIVDCKKDVISVNIPEGIVKINDGAFEFCILTSITIPSSVTEIGDYVFSECGAIKSIICLATTAPIITNNTFFIMNSTNGVLKVLGGSDYSTWMEQLSSYNWTIEILYEPQECTNLVITAKNVNGRQTTTTISYTATTNGINTYTNEQINGIEVTGTAISNSFEQNTDTVNTIVRTITFEYMGVTAETTIIQGVWVDQSYSINLNNQWQLSTKYANFDSETYDGIYESFSNHNVNSSSATCIVTINDYNNFTLYIGSYGEGSYDYTVAFDIDGTSTQKVTTKGFQYAPTSIDKFKKVEYTNLDGGEHTITIVYRKDSSANYNDDKGYLLIPKEQL